MTEEALTKYFEYLDELRESGQTNMYGAGPYLAHKFGLDRHDAKDVTLAWMRTFDKGSMPERVSAARDPGRPVPPHGSGP